MSAVLYPVAPSVALGFNAHQLFGLLLYREQGKTLGEIAALVQVPADLIGTALNSAEAGELERVPAHAGSVCRQHGNKNRKASPATGGSTELFLPRWQRAVLRRIAMNGGMITLSEANSIRGSYPDGVIAGIEPLRVALKANGMEWQMVRGGYRIEAEALAQLRALIANRWQVATA